MHKASRHIGYLLHILIHLAIRLKGVEIQVVKDSTQRIRRMIFIDGYLLTFVLESLYIHLYIHLVVNVLLPLRRGVYTKAYKGKGEEKGFYHERFEFWGQKYE